MGSLFSRLKNIFTIHSVNSLIDLEKEKAIRTEISKHHGISVRHLNLSVNGNHILKDISVDIPDKKITCIIGHSGCGKSTLLKTLNRLNDDVAGIEINGHIYIDGEDLFGKNAEVTHIRKKIGLVAQRPTPLPMSIFDNVAYGCRIHGIRKKSELKAIVETNLRAVGIWEEVKNRLHGSASALSIGQQQRLCLARGLAVQPEFILGDEATSALDPVSSRLIEDLFVELKQKYGIILVTHTLRQALKMADFVIFIYMGKIIETGSAKDLLEHPKEELTKQYLSG